MGFDACHPFGRQRRQRQPLDPSAQYTRALRGRDLAQLDARGLQLVNVMLNAGLQPVREEDEVAPLNS
ncbi:MAG TPA: hypothetical protein PKA36_05905, partial [Pseudoxanthomonas mexicana]|nr:hypothetical protein [Pseudoxanthomonas mexicana]